MTLSIISLKGCYSFLPQQIYSSNVYSRATECRIIKHELGESCVPLKPQRIIALDEMTMEMLLALDLKPIAVIQPNIAGSNILKFSNKADNIVPLGKGNQPNIEKMVQLNPDFILGFSISREQYKLFSQIAPTVTFDYIQTGWKDAFLNVGEITGKTETAQKLLDFYQQRVQELRAIVNNRFKKTTVSVSRFYAGNQVAEFRTKYSFPGNILLEVGLSFPKLQHQLTNNPNQTLISVSLERLELLDADVLFVALDPGSQEYFQKYQNSQLWQKLNVVKNQRVYIVDSGYWIFGNILSANAILDDVFKYLVTTS